MWMKGGRREVASYAFQCGVKRDEIEGYEGACSLIDKGQGLRPCRELDSRLRLFSAKTIHALRPWSLEFSYRNSF